MAEDYDPVLNRKRERAHEPEDQDSDQTVTTRLVAAEATALTTDVATTSQTSEAFDLEIREAAPSLLVVSAKGGDLTLHTNLKAAVAEVNLKLSLNGGELFNSSKEDSVFIWLKRDALGNLVVKADGDDVKELLEGFWDGSKTSARNTTVEMTIELTVTLDERGKTVKANSTVRVRL